MVVNLLTMIIGDMSDVQWRKWVLNRARLILKPTMVLIIINMCCSTLLIFSRLWRNRNDSFVKSWDVDSLCRRNS